MAKMMEKFRDRVLFLAQAGLTLAALLLKAGSVRLVPKTKDLEKRWWSEDARLRIDRFSVALSEGDVERCLQHGELEWVGVGAPSDEYTRCVEYGKELEGLMEALSWLEQFSKDVEESAQAAFISLVQLGVNPRHACHCESEEKAGASETAVFNWLHAHHTEYNRAVWEIISSKPGLIDQLRAEIQKDLDGPLHTWTDVDPQTFRQECQTVERRPDGSIPRSKQHVFGEVTSHQWAKTLLANFVTDKPSPRWVGVIKPCV